MRTHRLTKKGVFVFSTFLYYRFCRDPTFFKAPHKLLSKHTKQIKTLHRQWFWLWQVTSYTPVILVFMSPISHVFLPQPMQSWDRWRQHSRRRLVPQVAWKGCLAKLADIELSQNCRFIKKEPSNSTFGSWETWRVPSQSCANSIRELYSIQSRDLFWTVQACAKLHKYSCMLLQDVTRHLFPWRPKNVTSLLPKHQRPLLINIHQ